MIAIPAAPVRAAHQLSRLATHLIDLLHPADQLFFGQLFALRRTLHAPFYLRLCLGADKDVEGRAALKKHVRVPAHNDAVLAQCGNLLNHLFLLHQQLHLRGIKIGSGGKRSAIGKGKVLPSMIGQGVFYIIRGQPDILCNRSDDLVVVIIKAGRIGQPLAQLPAAAAELTADGDNPHCFSSLSAAYACFTAFPFPHEGRHSACRRCPDMPEAPLR